MKYSWPLALILVLAFAGGCSSSSSKKTTSSISGSSELAVDSLDDDRDAVEEEAKAREEHEYMQSAYPVDDMVLRNRHMSFLSERYKNNDYDQWVSLFTGKGRERFQRQINKGERYRDLVFGILKKYDLPTDLYYIGLIESGYSTHIKSHAGATGPWQFMKGTAVRYGLIVNRSLDERVNIVKSTEAAAQYFRDLYNIFGNWELALCAYNSGEFRVINAIRQGNTRDLAQLINLKLLPKETRNYVPKLLAARELVNNNDKHDFERDGETFVQGKAVLTIRRSTTLPELSKFLNISVADLQLYNPEVMKSYVQVPKQGWAISLPLDSVTAGEWEQFNRQRAPALPREFLAKKTLKKGRVIASNSPSTGKKAKSMVKRTSSYRVQKGDGLMSIARKFRVSMEAIRDLNKLKTAKLHVNQVIRIPEIDA